MGRKSDYHKYGWDEKLPKIKGWARDGLSNKQIAHNIGINEKTLYVWIKKYPEFGNALKVSKEVADYEVENALHKEATGYYYTEQNVSNTGEVVEVEKYARPKVSAQKYWLNNRQKGKWSSIERKEISGPDGGPIETKSTNLENLSDEELEKLEKILEKASGDKDD